MCAKTELKRKKDGSSTVFGPAKIRLACRKVYFFLCQLVSSFILHVPLGCTIADIIILFHLANTDLKKSVQCNPEEAS